MGDVKAVINRTGSMTTGINNNSISITTRIEEASKVVVEVGLKEVESASIKAQDINNRRCTTTSPINNINSTLNQRTSHTMSRSCHLLIISSNSRTIVVAIAEKVIDSISSILTSNYQRTNTTVRVTKTTSMTKITVVISISNGEEVMGRAK